MFEAVPSPFLVPDDDSFRIEDARTRPPKDAPSREECVARMEKRIGELSRLQSVLYAQDRWAVLVIFQAMDAAGKDGTIGAVMSGVNPTGCDVHSFKQPSAEELDHDFLWRTGIRLPERGRIGIFNRSYYEETLVVRVHPEYLEPQHLPHMPKLKRLWKERYESICDHEKHLARNGTMIVKFWLNVSKGEQRRRFLARIEDRERHWKFNAGDIAERRYWKRYQEAYEDVLRATSRRWAPWYAIPADDKPFMRFTVAEILVKSLKSLGSKYPGFDPKLNADLARMKSALEREKGSR